MRPCETKAERPENIFVEGHTPAAFQSHVQTKTGYFPTPVSSPPVFRGRKAGQSGLGGARVSTFSYPGSWDMLWSTPVLQLRHSLSSHTVPSLQLSMTVNPEEKTDLERIPGVISSALSSNFHTRTSYKNMGQIYALSFRVCFYNPPFLKILMQCKTTCLHFSAIINKHSSLSP